MFHKLSLHSQLARVFLASRIEHVPLELADSCEIIGESADSSLSGNFMFNDEIDGSSVFACEPGDKEIS